MDKERLKDLLFWGGMLLLFLIATAKASPVPVAPDQTQSQYPFQWNNEETEQPYLIYPEVGYINQTSIYGRVILAFDGTCTGHPEPQVIRIVDRNNSPITGFISITLDGVESKHLFKKVAKNWEYELQNNQEYECGEHATLVIIATHNLTDISQPFKFGVAWGTESSIVVADTLGSTQDLGKHIVRADNNTIYALWANSTNTSVSRSIDNGDSWALWETLPLDTEPTCNASPKDYQMSIALDSNKDVMVAVHEWCYAGVFPSYNAMSKFRFVSFNHTTGAVIKNTYPRLDQYVASNNFVGSGADLAVLSNNSIVYGLAYLYTQSNGDRYYYTEIYRSNDMGGTWTQIGTDLCYSYIASGFNGFTCGIPRMAAYSASNVSILMANATTLSTAYQFREFRTNLTAWSESNIVAPPAVGDYPGWYGSALCVDGSGVRHIFYSAGVSKSNYTNSTNFSVRTEIASDIRDWHTIACNGTDIYAMGQNDTSPNHILYLHSSNNGGSWGSQTDLTGEAGSPYGLYTDLNSPTFDYLYQKTPNTYYDWFGTKNNASSYQVIVGTCNVNYHPAANFSFKDEANMSASILANATINITSDTLGNKTASLESVNNFTICLINTANGTFTARITYLNSTSSVRDYVLSGDNSTNTNITLYLLANTYTSAIQFITKNQFGNPLPNRVQHYLRYFPANNSYVLVAVGLTDSEGSYVANIFTNGSTFYQIISFKEDSTAVEKLFTQELVYCIAGQSCTHDLIIQTGGEDIAPDDYWQSVYGKVVSNCSFTNSTRTIACTYADSSGESHVFDLNASRLGWGNPVSVCNATSSGASGTLLCTISDTNLTGKVYTWSLVRKSDTQILQQGMIDLREVIFKSLGLGVAFLLIITTAMIGMFNPLAGVLLGAFGLIASATIGLIDIPIAALAGILLVGFILAWRYSRH